MIFHIPHASTVIPADARRDIVVDDAHLAEEIRLLTDHHTDTLFEPLAVAGDSIVKCPVSRFVTDVERFPVDAQEPMSAIGMGAVYLRDTAGRPFRASLAGREGLMQRYYQPHHAALERAVQAALQRDGRVLIVDCHSFPAEALACERDPAPPRPEVCIGTDAFHTPEAVASALETAYRQAGYTVARNRPFAGALVPLSAYGKDPRVLSVMIELRRDIYMDERSSALFASLTRITAANAAAIGALRSWFSSRRGAPLGNPQ